MSYDGWLPLCAICKQPVSLESSKTDEYGSAVHEECYVSTLVAKKLRQFRMEIEALRVRFHLPYRRFAA